MKKLGAAVTHILGFFAQRSISTGRRGRAEANAAPQATDAGESTRPPDLDEILPRLDELKRRAYIPITEDGDAHLSGSKFSGHPQVTDDHPWPTCPNCKNKMQLFWQQDLADKELDHTYPSKSGLLQFFYCVNSEPLCEVDCESYSPFSSVTVIRVVPIANSRTEDLPEDYFPAKKIVGWKAVDDYPNWEELGETMVSLSDAEENVLFNAYPVPGDKIGGWPFWIQSAEYPNCSTCSKKMTFLLQVDSEVNLPYMFGDAGCGQLSFCSDHPEVMSFHWACH